MSILRTAARTAVASSVHGRVQRRQQARWAGSDQAAAQPATAANTAPPAVHTPAPPVTVEAPHRDPADLLGQLERLGALRESGVLTEEEFTVQKARILAG